jgi:polysaccharide pyruvyl transferase WcaK-like protein
MKTLLYGAFGRHNFGDMLFPHIITKLLDKNNIDLDIEYCDLLSRDMTSMGGHNVKSITEFTDYDKEINIIHVGGETGGCGVSQALHMLHPGPSHRLEIDKIKKLELEPVYLLPKKNYSKPNYFITNAIGGVNSLASQLLKEYDYTSFRDKASYDNFKSHSSQPNNIYLTPDSATLTRNYFDDLIKSRNSTEPVKQLRHAIGSKYIAIQLNAKCVRRYNKQLNKVFQDIISRTNLPIVFFCAGVATNHDSVHDYKKFFSNLPNDKVFFFESLDIWNICNVISNASFVLGTSLHVRIISQQYSRPRLSLTSKAKLINYIKTWDNVLDCISGKDIECIPDYISNSLINHDICSDVERTNYLEDMFVSKSTWVNLFI